MGCTRSHLSLFFACILVLGPLLVLPINMAQTDPPANGDWTVADITVVSDQVIDLKGNLTVTATGDLTLDNVTLIMNAASPLNLTLKVEAGGQLTVTDSNIISGTSSRYFAFKVLGSLDMNNTTVEYLWSSGNLGGIDIESDDVIISNSTIGYSLGSGITLLNSSAIIIHNDIHHNAVRGICALNYDDEGSYIAWNTVHHNEDGINLYYADNSTIENNIVTNNTGFGITDFAQGMVPMVPISGNVIQFNYIGMVLGGLRPVKVHDNNISFNHYGVSIMGTRLVEVYSNQIVGSETLGITTRDSPDAIIHHNEIYGSGTTGIRLDGVDDIQVHNNTILNSGGSGIYISDSYDVDIIDNNMIGSGYHGIRINKEGQALISGNTIIDSAEAGIYGMDLVDLEISGNKIYDSGTAGIELWSEASADIKGNEINDNTEEGIELMTDNEVVIEDNELLRNGLNGIKVLKAPKGVLPMVNNTFKENSDLGIYLMVNCTTHISGNIIEGNGIGGIESRGGSHDLSRNQFNANVPFDIRSLGSTINSTEDVFIGSTLDGVKSLELIDSTVVLDRTVVQWTDTGMVIDDSEVMMWNVSIDYTDTVIEFLSYGQVLSHNSSLDKELISFGKDDVGSEFREFWYIDVGIVDSKDRPLSGANVTFPFDDISVQLDDNGNVSGLALTGYYRTKADGGVKVGHDLDLEVLGPVADNWTYGNITFTSDTVLDLSFDFAPEISEMGPVTVFEGVEVALDIFDHISDPDHDLSELNVTISGDRQVRNGFLYLAYDEEIEGGQEVITVNVSDGQRSASTNFTVYVTPFNDPPVISYFDQVHVFEDIMYSFDISPHIFDEENDDLTITIDSDVASRFIEVDGLLLNMTYPQWVWIDVVRFTVSDGTNSVTGTFVVNVTQVNDAPWFEEVPTLSTIEDMERPFDLGSYLNDADDELEDLYLVFEATEHAWVEGSVLFLFYPGGILEDILEVGVSDGNLTTWTNITIQVSPVDDPPEVAHIPDQNVVVGVAFTFDVSLYVTDVDTRDEDLMIMTRSKYVTADGLNVTILYPKDHKAKKDTLSIWVGDETTLVQRTFNVTITGHRSPGTVITMNPFGPYIYALIPLTIILTAIGLYAYRRLRYEWFEVKDAFLIYQDGRLLVHKGSALDMDKEILGGMLTAVQEFMADSLGGIKAGKIREFEYEDLRIAIERAENLYLAVFIQGFVTDALRTRMVDVLDKVWEGYGDCLMDWDGDHGDLEGIGGLLSPLIKEEGGPVGTMDGDRMEEEGTGAYPKDAAPAPAPASGEEE